MFRINSKFSFPILYSFPSSFSSIVRSPSIFVLKFSTPLAHISFSLLSLFNILTSPISFFNLFLAVLPSGCQNAWVDLLSGEPVKVSPAPEDLTRNWSRWNKAQVLPVCQPVLWFTDGDLHMYTWFTVRKQLLSTVPFWKFSVFPIFSNCLQQNLISEVNRN